MIDCIPCTGPLDRKGYGRTEVSIRPGRRGWQRFTMSAHRLAWEQAWGLKIPPGMVVRHTCDNPPCVNPLHLQLGTQGDNERDKATRGRHWQQAKTHCPQGHALEEGNLRSGRGRKCLTCKRTQERARLARKREARALPSG